MGALGGVLARLGRIFLGSLKSTTVTHFEGVRGVPGGVPEASWGVLGASWGLLAGSWGRLAASWGPPKAVLGQLGAPLGRLQRVLRCLWSVLRHLGASWRVLARLEAVWTESWPPGGGAPKPSWRAVRALGFGPSGFGFRAQSRAKRLVEGVARRGGPYIIQIYYPKGRGPGTPNVVYDARWRTSGSAAASFVNAS